MLAGGDRGSQQGKHADGESGEALEVHPIVLEDGSEGLGGTSPKE